jgi:plasmid maintenance system antidote protein VapI
MDKYEKIYQRLRKQYTDEEIADSMLIPADLTAEEQEEANKELRAFRLKLLSEMTEEQRLYSDLLRFRYQLEEYIENREYDDSMGFGVQLEEYVRILKRTKKKMSEELDVHYTKLSRIINNRENPNIEFMYRLEEHSGGLIPALVWWKLLIKKQEFEIKRDKVTREIEAAKVKRAIAYQD